MQEINRIANEILSLKVKGSGYKKNSKEIRLKKIQDSRDSLKSEFSYKTSTITKIDGNNIRFSIEGLENTYIEVEIPWRIREKETKEDFINRVHIVGESGSFANEILRPDNFRCEIAKIDEGQKFSDQVKNTSKMLDAMTEIITDIQTNKKSQDALFNYYEQYNSVYDASEADKSLTDNIETIKALQLKLAKLIEDEALNALKKGINLNLRDINTKTDNYILASSLRNILRVDDSWKSLIEAFSSDVGYKEFVFGLYYDNISRGNITSKVCPVFWDRSNDTAFLGSKISLKKTNKKSVSILVDESTDKNGLNVKTDDYDRSRNTSYSARNTYYVRTPHDSVNSKNIKTAIKKSRAVLIALEYNAVTISEEVKNALKTK